MIDGIEGISELRKDFYKTMLQQRFEKILLSTYQRLQREEAEDCEHKQ